MDINFPKNEKVWTVYLDINSTPKFFTTAKPMRDFYFLYEITDNGYKKLGKSKLPLELEEKFDIRNKLTAKH